MGGKRFYLILFALVILMASFDNGAEAIFGKSKTKTKSNDSGSKSPKKEQGFFGRLFSGSKNKTRTTSAPIKKSHQTKVASYPTQGPLHHAPIHHAPMHQTPMYQAPIHQAPMHQAPIHQAPMHQAPIYSQPPSTVYVQPPTIVVQHTKEKSSVGDALGSLGVAAGAALLKGIIKKETAKTTKAPITTKPPSTNPSILVLNLHDNSAVPNGPGFSQYPSNGFATNQFSSGSSYVQVPNVPANTPIPYGVVCTKFKVYENDPKNPGNTFEVEKEMCYKDPAIEQHSNTALGINGSPYIEVPNVPGYAQIPYGLICNKVKEYQKDPQNPTKFIEVEKNMCYKDPAANNNVNSGFVQNSNNGQGFIANNNANSGFATNSNNGQVFVPGTMQVHNGSGAIHASSSGQLHSQFNSGSSNAGAVFGQTSNNGQGYVHGTNQGLIQASSSGQLNSQFNSGSNAGAGFHQTSNNGQGYIHGTNQVHNGPGLIQSSSSGQLKSQFNSGSNAGAGFHQTSNNGQGYIHGTNQVHNGPGLIQASSSGQLNSQFNSGSSNTGSGFIQVPINGPVYGHGNNQVNNGHGFAQVSTGGQLNSTVNSIISKVSGNNQTQVIVCRNVKVYEKDPWNNNRMIEVSKRVCDSAQPNANIKLPNTPQILNKNAGSGLHCNYRGFGLISMLAMLIAFN